MRDDARLLLPRTIFSFFLSLYLLRIFGYLSLKDYGIITLDDICYLTLTQDSNDSVVYAMSATSFRMTVTSSRSRQWRVLDVD